MFPSTSVDFESGLEGYKLVAVVSVGFVEGNTGCRSGLHRVVSPRISVNNPKGRRLRLKSGLFSPNTILDGLNLSLTPPVDGNAFIHCVITLAKDIVIIFGKLENGSE